MSTNDEDRKIEESPSALLYEDSIKEIKDKFLSISNLSRNGYQRFVITLEETLKWIGIEEEKISTMKKNIMSRYINEEYGFEKNENYIIIKSIDPKYKDRNKSRTPNQIHLNDEGFKMLCMIFRSRRAIQIRKYYIQLEKEYIEALERDGEENQCILEDLNEKTRLFNEHRNLNISLEKELKEWKGQCDKEHWARVKTEKDRDLAQIDSCVQQMHNRTIEEENEELRMSINEDMNVMDLRHIELEYLRKKFLTKQAIYLVSPEKLKKLIMDKFKKKGNGKVEKKVNDGDTDSSEDEEFLKNYIDTNREVPGKSQQLRRKNKISNYLTDSEIREYNISIDSEDEDGHLDELEQKKNGKIIRKEDIKVKKRKKNIIIRNILEYDIEHFKNVNIDKDEEFYYSFVPHNKGRVNYSIPAESILILNKQHLKNVRKKLKEMQCLKLGKLYEISLRNIKDVAQQELIRLLK
jgi:phage anti-repressor protein